jgi:hypothetical protein
MLASIPGCEKTLFRNTSNYQPRLDLFKNLEIEYFTAAGGFRD